MRRSISPYCLQKRLNDKTRSLVYAYIIRHLGLASFSSENSDEGDLETAFELLFRFLPFLIDRKSTLVYTDIEGVIADLCSRFTQVYQASGCSRTKR